MLRPSIYLPSLILIPAIAFLAGACGGGSSGPALGAGGPDSDQVAYSVKIEAEPHSLSEAESNLVARINAGQTVSFKHVTMLAQSRQEREYTELQGVTGNGEDDAARFESERLAARERFAAIVPANLAELGPSAIKLSLEAGLIGYFGKPLEYSLEKASTLDPLLENVLQCYSGTMLYSFVARTLPGSVYRARNFVTIFTKGHVQPGYMKSEAGNFRLYGIEMTQNGAADVHFGLAKELRNDIVVVDSDHFLLTELLKGRIKNKCAVQDAIIKLTAKKYGIEKPKGLCSDKMADDNAAPPVGATSIAAKKGKLVGGSLFSFGTPDTAPGRRARAAAAPGLTDLSAQYSGANLASASRVAAERERREAYYLLTPKGRLVLLLDREALQLMGIQQELRSLRAASGKNLCEEGQQGCDFLKRVATEDGWKPDSIQPRELECPEFVLGINSRSQMGVLSCERTRTKLPAMLHPDAGAKERAPEKFYIGSGDDRIVVSLGMISGDSIGLPSANLIILERRLMRPAAIDEPTKYIRPAPVQQAPRPLPKQERPGAGELRR